MKVCVVQTKPATGDILKNIDSHKNFIAAAITNKAKLVIFPELSLTGYEPKLAKQLATTPQDDRFEVFQKISNEASITIGVGIPIKSAFGVCIGMVIFQPNVAPRVYSKKYLHPDEEPYFISGENFPCLEIEYNKVAIAICYELSIPEHSENAFKNGAQIYIASVAKSAGGVENASQTLASIAKKYMAPVLMANNIGYCDDFESAGYTSAWNDKGMLLKRLDDKNEGILIFDTDTQQIAENIDHGAFRI